MSARVIYNKIAYLKKTGRNDEADILKDELNRIKQIKINKSMQLLLNKPDVKEDKKIGSLKQIYDRMAYLRKINREEEANELKEELRRIKLNKIKNKIQLIVDNKPDIKHDMVITPKIKEEIITAVRRNNKQDDKEDMINYLKEVIRKETDLRTT